MTDPTQTVTLRKAYMREYRKRWAVVVSEVKRYLRERPFSLPIFRSWLRNLLDTLLPTSGTLARWQNQYINPAFEKGVKLLNRDMRREGITGFPTDIDAVLTNPSVALELQTAQQEARQGLNKIKRDTVIAVGGALLALSASELKDLALVEGVTVDRLQKVGRTRSQTLATTSVVKTVATSSLAYLSLLGFKLVSPIIEAVFTTAEDDRVCPECQALAERDNGRGAGVYGIWEARGIIPVHPRCRCRWVYRIFGKDLPFGLRRASN